MIQPTHEYTLAEKEEYIKCAADAKYFIETYVSLYNKKTGGYGAAKLFPHLEDMLSDVEQNQRNTFFKYRQAGCTSLALAYLVYQLTFNNRKSCLLISGNLHLAGNLLENVQRMVNSLPTFLRPRTIVGGNTQRRMIFENGNQVDIQSITRDGIRGFSPDLVIVDEFMYAQHLEEWYYSFVGAMSINAVMIAISGPRFGHKVPSIFTQGNVRCFQRYQDPRFNTDLYWELEVHDEFGNNIGSEVRRNVPEAEHITLLREGYLPHSTWSNKLREDVLNDQMANEYFNTENYQHV